MRSNRYEVTMASKDGVNWKTLGFTEFIHHSSGLSIFKNRIWSIGGLDDGYHSLKSALVFSTPDGIHWQREQDLPYLVSATDSYVLNDQLWITGGFNGVASSSSSTTIDGTSWAVGSAGISGLFDMHSIVSDGTSAWLLGGRSASPTFTTRVFRTSDGLAWTSVGNLPAGRYNGSAALFNGALWYAGGEYSGGVSNAVFTSTNGSNWTQTANLPETRNMGALLGFKGALLYIGGSSGSAKTNVWASSDGRSWTHIANLPYPHTGHAVIFPLCDSN
ncbi:MAG: hypothetical protein AB7F86_10610 [Bdellovibrionales bacterium]